MTEVLSSVDAQKLLAGQFDAVQRIEGDGLGTAPIEGWQLPLRYRRVGAADRPCRTNATLWPNGWRNDTGNGVRTGSMSATCHWQVS